MIFDALWRALRHGTAESPPECAQNVCRERPLQSTWTITNIAKPRFSQNLQKITKNQRFLDVIIRLPLKENAWKCMKIHENIWKWNSDVPIRQIRSRTFWSLRPIYTQGSITNVTKHHKFGTLTRPGTLLGQAANCFILGEKIHRNLIVCPHLFTRPLISNSSKQIAFDFFCTILRRFNHYRDFCTLQGRESDHFLACIIFFSSFRPV